MLGKVFVCADEGPEEKKAREVSQSPKWLLKKLWSEAVNHFWAFCHQQDGVRNILLLACEVPEKDTRISTRLLPRKFLSLYMQVNLRRTVNSQQCPVNHKLKEVVFPLWRALIWLPLL
jgi:hypothetical protein